MHLVSKRLMLSWKNSAVFALLKNEEPTMFFGVPTLFAALLAHPDPPESLGSLRLCVSAGEALPAPVWHAWKDATGLAIIAVRRRRG